MPATPHPTSNFILAVRSAGGDEAVASVLWFDRMTYAQRRKWTEGKREPYLTADERFLLHFRQKTELGKAILGKLIANVERIDPVWGAMAAAAIAGWTGVDLADQLWSSANTKWNDFLKALPLPSGWGVPALPDIPAEAQKAFDEAVVKPYVQQQIQNRQAILGQLQGKPSGSSGTLTGNLGWPF